MRRRVSSTPHSARADMFPRDGADETELAVCLTGASSVFMDQSHPEQRKLLTPRRKSLRGPPSNPSGRRRFHQADLRFRHFESRHNVMALTRRTPLKSKRNEDRSDIVRVRASPVDAEVVDTSLSASSAISPNLPIRTALYRAHSAITLPP
jgi:hypothetical protein